MLRFLIIIGLLLFIIFVVVCFFYRHEIEMWLHRKDRKDSAKALRYKSNLLKEEIEHNRGLYGTEARNAELRQELEETNKIIDELRKGR